MFGYGIDKKTLYIILGILVLVSLSSITTDYLISLLFTLPAVIIAITFHEYAHAFAADKLGDTTPRNQGRLTLNPLSHIDPFGIVLLIFAHVGWGKPVQINPNNFTSNKSRSTCEALVSLAGPLMNFIIAIIATVIYYALYKYMAYTTWTQIVKMLLDNIIIINIGLGTFNLVPLPPLDGEKIFRKLLPYKVQSWLDNNSQTLYIIFMVLWITGLLGRLISPVITLIFDLIFKCVGFIFGLF